jgi:hypothetical protein
MIEVNSTVTSITNSYNQLLGNLPSWGQSFINLFLVLLVILLYLLFVRGFYASVSKKDIFGLNLNQYNKSSVPFAYLLYKGFLFLIEYIVIVPFVVFFWFSVLSLFLIILTDLTVGNIFLISAVIVIAARMTSYYKKELSENVAKLIPFTLLSVALLTPSFFKFETILSHFQSLPQFFGDIIIYLLFIVIFEVFLRVFDFIISLFDISFNNTNLQEKMEEQEDNN